MINKTNNSISKQDILELIGSAPNLDKRLLKVQVIEILYSLSPLELLGV